MTFDKYGHRVTIFEHVDIIKNVGDFGVNVINSDNFGYGVNFTFVMILVCYDLAWILLPYYSKNN